MILPVGQQLVTITTTSYYSYEQTTKVFFNDLTFFHQFSEQAAPLIAEDVGPGEAAIPTTHAQVGDAFIHQVEGGGQTALTCCEGFASGAADYSPALQPLAKMIVLKKCLITDFI